jgi:hypothetical protein
MEVVGPASEELLQIGRALLDHQLVGRVTGGDDHAMDRDLVADMEVPHGLLVEGSLESLHDAPPRG